MAVMALRGLTPDPVRVPVPDPGSNPDPCPYPNPDPLIKTLAGQQSLPPIIAPYHGLNSRYTDSTLTFSDLHIDPNSTPTTPTLPCQSAAEDDGALGVDDEFDIYEELQVGQWELGPWVLVRWVGG